MLKYIAHTGEAQQRTYLLLSRRDQIQALLYFLLFYFLMRRKKGDPFSITKEKDVYAGVCKRPRSLLSSVGFTKNLRRKRKKEKEKKWTQKERKKEKKRI